MGGSSFETLSHYKIFMSRSIVPLSSDKDLKSMTNTKNFSVKWKDPESRSNHFTLFPLLLLICGDGLIPPPLTSSHRSYYFHYVLVNLTTKGRVFEEEGPSRDGLSEIPRLQKCGDTWDIVPKYFLTD